MTAEDSDVAVVGGSVAGCATAQLFAERGASVALVERRPDPAAYKITCTHAIPADGQLLAPLAR
jgi:2-polyprenyl-6-methoxyphenol hydroxylase-like FAD-dependent oxidoreductase